MKSPHTPVAYGIVGVGGFGAKRRDRLRASGAFEIIGGVDVRNEAITQAEAEESRPLKRYASVESMAADPRIEAVFISTPAALHVPQAMIAARAGKAVFCEKPLGPNRQACRELVEFCEQQHIPHGHGFSARFSPLWQQVKRMIDDGVLGQIVSVSAATMHTGGLALKGDNWRFKADDNPGGPLFQCGIHKIDTLRMLFGEGRWHSGMVNRTITASPTDDAYILLGTFGGVPTTFHSHYVACYRHAMEIYGTRGDLYITEFPEKLEHKITDLTSGFEPVHDLTSRIPPSDAELDSLRDFAAAVRERRQPRMSGREGLASLELVFQAAEISDEAPGFRK
jgi:predicted dehydrogenase